MKLPCLLFCSALLAAAWPLRAETPPAPEIVPRVEFEFPTTNGQAYFMEGSTDGQNWVPLGEPVFGDGLAARVIPPGPAAAYRQFRVRPVNADEIGPAITALGGKTICLNDSGRARQLIFFPEIQGVTRGVLKTDEAHARSFIWSTKRTTRTHIVVELTFFGGTTSTVELEFSNNLLGSYEMRDRNLDLEVQGMEGGLFSVHQGRIRDKPEQAVLPSSLVGRTLGLEEGGDLTRIEFPDSQNALITRSDGSSTMLQYLYDNHSPVISELVLTEEGKPTDRYELAPNSQATGNYNRSAASPGGGGEGGQGEPAPPAKPGVFSLSTPVVPQSSGNGAPRTLGGRVLQLNGSHAVTLTFNEDGTGTATMEKDGSVEVTPFIYDYSPTGDSDASLALTYPGADTDRVEDYNLDFSGSSSGDFESSVYQGGEVAQTDTGSFNTADP